MNTTTTVPAFVGKLVLSLSMLTAPVGCSNNEQQLPTPAGSENGSITVNGVVRTFRLYPPANPGSNPMPVLIAINGGGMRAEAFPQEAEFAQLAETEGFLFVVPISELLPDNEGEWQLNTTSSSRQDIDFMEALIDELANRYSVDASRVYGTGYSLGSMFNYEIACQLPERFAAIASHAGTMPVRPESCRPARTMAMLHLHGTEDTIIPYHSTWAWKQWAEVGTMRDIPGLITFWSGLANCQESIEERAPDSLHFVHQNCDGDVRVEHHRIEGLGHGWPETLNGQSTHQVIWNFLSSFQRP